MRLRIPTPHARPWSGAFNVVMATAIVSISALGAGLRAVSDVLVVIAVVAFVPLAALDVIGARHPITMLHRARQPGRAFPALGFVADACVLGTRIVTSNGARRTIAEILLATGALVWLAIVFELGRYPRRVLAMRARAEWLLATVASEGLAILLAHLSHQLRWLAVALWLLGGVLYLVVMALLARRVRDSMLRRFEFTPDWWIVMGGAAIFTLAAATLDRGRSGSAVEVIGVIGWITATAWIPGLLVAEWWRARELRPRFTPERWTMVFPLGMYSVCGQLGGTVFGLRWMHSIGQAWTGVALLAWLLVAAGEVHYAFRPHGGT